MLKIYSIAFVLFFQLLVIRPVLAGEDKRPNILYFYVDDMGWGSIGPNGQAERRARGLPSVKTPNLDRLAAAGVNFSRGYGCHVCSPARSSQQTGFHQGHTFADRNDPDNARKAIRADDPSIGKSLSAAGYVTGYWGKWGYGGSKSQDNPTIDNVQTLPTSHGYAHVLAELHHVRAHTFFQPTLWHAPATVGAIGGVELIPNTRERLRMLSNLPEAPSLHHHAAYPQVAYCDDAYAFAVLQFVRDSSLNYHATGTPFLGILAVQIPHAPFDEVTKLPDWDAAYRDDPHFANLAEQSQQWAAMVTRIDQHFGNILAVLEDPNSDGDTSDSVADNTLVVFQSDNGGPSGKSRGEFAANGGLSGSKGMIQEGGIRVPLVMRWPTKINANSELKAGSTCEKVVDVTDLLPTFCELANATVPLGIDGVSIAPTLTGTGKQRRRDFIIHEAGNGQSIIRDDLKLVRSNRGAPRLYDLKEDPTESNNIAVKFPKVADELERLLLGEQVDRPKGFANTYHTWTGKHQAVTSEAGNWSNYVYENAGVTYMEDSGAPRVSWVAKIENRPGVGLDLEANSNPIGHASRIAVVDADLELLALEVSGDQGKGTTQTVLVPKDRQLLGRNEVRLSEGARLVLEGGTVGSLRWIDIWRDAELSGSGTVEGTLYNSGTVESRGGQPLRIVGDFHQADSGRTVVSASENGPGSLKVQGAAHLAGTLRVDLAPWLPSRGETFVVLTATKIIGRFENDSITVGPDEYHLSYTPSSVSLTASP